MCAGCSSQFTLETSNLVGNKPPVALGAILGCSSLGLGKSALNELLCCMNIPPITKHAFQEDELDVAKKISTSFEESVNEAVEDIKHNNRRLEEIKGFYTRDILYLEQ